MHSFIQLFHSPSIGMCITQHAWKGVRKGGGKDSPHLSGVSSNDLNITIGIFPLNVEVQGLSGARKLNNILEILREGTGNQELNLPFGQLNYIHLEYSVLLAYDKTLNACIVLYCLQSDFSHSFL